jgi:hypothetical protein
MLNEFAICAQVFQADARADSSPARVHQGRLHDGPQGSTIVTFLWIFCYNGIEKHVIVEVPYSK